MKREDYINEVTALIKNKTVRKDVRKEIEAHIDDRMEYYLNAGYDEDVSLTKALEKMGNPTEIAKSLEKIHNNTLWIILSLVFLILYISGLVYATYNISDYMYINLVDWAWVNESAGVMSILTLCAATASFCFAVKSKSIFTLKTYGTLAIMSPLMTYYALRPAGYQFISVFTDFPAAVINKVSFFGSDAFYNFFESFEKNHGIVIEVLLWILWAFFLILVLVFIAFPIITGSISFVYAGKLKYEENSSGYEKALQKFMSVLVAVCMITVVGTGAEFAWDTALSIKSDQEFEAHKDEYYTKAKKEFDSIEIPMSEEDAIALQIKNNEYYEYKKMELSDHIALTVYVNFQEIELRDYNKDGIYDAKRIFNSLTFNMPEKEAIKDLQLGSSIEDLYKVADFSSFMSYMICEMNNETYIEIRVCVKGNDEYWLDYTNGKLVSSTALQ